MAAVSLLSLLLVIQVDPSNLTEGILSPSAEVRAAALDALEAGGLRSLPALRAFSQRSTGEPRRAATDLIRRLGGIRMRRATRVQPVLKDVMLADAINDLALPTGATTGLWIRPESPWRTATVSLLLTESLTFFEAIDRLGEKNGFRAGLDPQKPELARSSPMFELVEREGPMPPTVYPGPYRISLVKLRRHHTVRQASARAEPMITHDFHAILEIAAEPGLLIQTHGSVRLNEAVDDQGHDLRSGRKAPLRTVETALLADSPSQVQVLYLPVPLQLPASHGTILARIRGWVPVLTVCRTDELFSLSLDDLATPRVSGGGVTLQIDRRNFETAVKTLEVTIFGEEPPSSAEYAGGPRQTTQTILKLPYNLSDHMRVEDRNGLPLAATCIATAPPGPDGTMTYRVQIPAKAPARIRYFGVAGVAIELPFDFRDLPIP